MSILRLLGIGKPSDAGIEGSWILQNTPKKMTSEGGDCFGPV